VVKQQEEVVLRQSEPRLPHGSSTSDSAVVEFAATDASAHATTDGSACAASAIQLQRWLRQLAGGLGGAEEGVVLRAWWQGLHDLASYNSASFHSIANHSASYNSASYHPADNNSASYHPAGNNSASYDSDSASYDSTSYNSASYDSASHHSTSYHSASHHSASNFASYVLPAIRLQRRLCELEGRLVCSQEGMVLPAWRQRLPPSSASMKGNGCLATPHPTSR